MAAGESGARDDDGDILHATHPDRPGVVDLRSDTMTQPTDEMRAAMADALVGDDLFGEDPTLTRLQEKAAKMLGMEASLFVPSGSMANIVAILAHTGGRAEVLAETQSHIFLHEGDSLATLGGCGMRFLPAERGVFTPETLTAAFLPKHFAYPKQGMVVIENTHNEAGGTYWTPQQVAGVAEVAHGAGLPVHCDGARIFHAAIAQDVAPERLVAPIDSAMFCFSKGLSAPVGSILCGTEALIERALPVRKQLGGAMRQAGILAAAAEVALDTMVDRLADDHARARRLAEGLHSTGYSVDPDAHPTNIVIADVTSLGYVDAEAYVAAAEKVGLLCLSVSPSSVRFVTHRHITDDKVQQALDAAAQLARGAA